MRRAVVALGLILAGCSDDDPCAGVATCVRVDVSSKTVEKIDQLELDILYDARHATTTTQATGGRTTTLPLATAIVLEVDGTAAVAVGVVAAGKLGAGVLGTGAGSVTVAPGAHATIALELAAIEDCEAGRLYCGGDKLDGDPETLYQCNAAGVPLARGRCADGCVGSTTDDAACAASAGTCVETGRYCGGDKVKGDPQSLYTCERGVGTAPVECADGCVVRSSGKDDACR